MDSVSALAQIMLGHDSPYFVILSSIYITSDIGIMCLIFIVSQFDFDYITRVRISRVTCLATAPRVALPSSSSAMISFSLNPR